MNQRHKKILDMLQHGRIAIPETAEKLGVTQMTIRRDLRELEKRKLLIQVKNGAAPYPPGYDSQRDENEITDEKLAIAEALYQKIFPVKTIFISTGSTALAFARVIARHNVLPMTVITNSLPVASSLFRSCCKVILLGGELRNNSLDLVGDISEKNISEYHVNWLISGCDGASADYGFYTSDKSLSNLEKKSINIAEHVAIITESAKFGKKALTRFAALQDIDLLVTDSALSDAEQEKLTASGMELLLTEKNQGAI